MIHRKKNDLLHKDATCPFHSHWQNSLIIANLRTSLRSLIQFFLSKVVFRFPSGEESTVFCRKNKDLQRHHMSVLFDLCEVIKKKIILQ